MEVFQILYKGNLLLCSLFVLSFLTPALHGFLTTTPNQKVASNFLFPFKKHPSHISSSLGLFGNGGDNAINADAPTLSSDFVWRLSLVLQNPSVPEFERPVQIWVRFVEDIGYEPPQGRVFVQDDPYKLCAVDDKGFTGFWQLSEDKEDRKDGLWVWGLFEEPLYPFLYFSIRTNAVLTEEISVDNAQEGREEMKQVKEISIFGGQDEEKIGVPNNTLYARFNHRRMPKEVGTTLTEGVITFKVTEIVKADLLGISTADVGENIECGSINAVVLSNK